MNKAAIIINLKAGTVRDLDVEQLKSQISEKFKSKSFETEFYSLTDQKLPALLEKIKAAGCSVAVAVGGDGTVNSVASMLCRQSIPMGLIPLGTFNLVAREFNIPTKVEDAVEAIANQHLADVDMVEVNGKHFINNSFLGLYPAFVKERDKVGFKNKRQKYLAMIKAAKNMLVKFPNLTLSIQTDSEKLKVTTPSVYIGVGAFNFESVFTKTSRDAPGIMSVAIARKLGRLENTIMLMRELAGFKNRKDVLKVIETKNLFIEGETAKSKVSMDGEIVDLEMPLSYKIIPKAFKICEGPKNPA